MAITPTGNFWVSAANTGLSTIWDKTGVELRPSVTIPSPANATSGGHPSGQVFNGSSDFKLPNGNPARFIFAGLDGVITGWNGGDNAVVALNNAKTGSVYTGIGIATNSAGANFLYMANFGKKRIDVYDGNWQRVDMAFKDADVPKSYAPFNIQNLTGKLYVMYAKASAESEEETGAGLGYVSIFNVDGTLDRHYISAGKLDAPWGVAAAPINFWTDEHGNPTPDVILVGNFGDGKINAFNKSGNYLGTLKSKGKPIEIGGLWGLSFPPATATAIDPGWLYFAAGPDEERDGLFGYLKNVRKE
ncbi:MAG: TIGR03118 family protein [Ginsengibacter sp.]